MSNGHTPSRRYGTLSLGDDLSALALVNNLARPARPALQPALDALTGCETGQEAWERAITRGLLPAAWAEDQARMFFENDGGPSFVPDSVDVVVALAADLEAVLTVEALWAEAAARLAPYGTEPFEQVWWVTPSTLVNRTVPDLEPLYDSVFDAWPPSINVARNVDLRTPFRRSRGKPGSLDGLVSALDRCGRAYGRWQGAARLKRAFAPPERQPGVAPNPFAPLLAIWQLGYIPAGIHGAACDGLIPRVAR